jgi:hypothetical protein
MEKRVLDGKKVGKKEAQLGEFINLYPQLLPEEIPLLHGKSSP